jgi:hypothetical protein
MRKEALWWFRGSVAALMLWTIHPPRLTAG